MRVNIRLQSILKGTLVLGVLFLIIVPLACGGAAAPQAPVVPTFTPPPTAVRPTTPPATSQLEPITSAPSGDLVAAGRELYTGGGGCAINPKRHDQNSRAFSIPYRDLGDLMGHPDIGPNKRQPILSIWSIL